MPLNPKDKDILLKHINKINSLKIKSKKGFENFTQNVDLPNALVIKIPTTASLQAVVSEIYELNQHKQPENRIIVRVAAGGRDENYSESYSLTPGVEADIIIQLVGDEFHGIKATDKKNVVSVGASVQIGELDSTLYDKYNLSLPTSSLIPYVTVAGLTANAGHGTGKDQPSFAGLIRAMTLCLPNGEIVRIDKNHKDFEKIRGAHLGLFGVVLNVELECTEAKKMQCVMEARSIPELIDEIKKGLYVNDPYVSVLYIPTYQADELTNTERKNVLIYRWRPVEKTINDVNSNSTLSNFIQNFEIKLEEDFHISDLLRAEPQLIPSYMMYIVSKLQVGKKDGISVGPWPTVHYQTAYPRTINDMDYLFEVSEDYSEVITAIEKLVTTLTDFAKEKKQYPINYAAYLRLFQGTNGGMSTSTHQPNHHVCGFDMVSTPGIPGYEAFRDTMTKFFIQELNAKPHWGKYLADGIDYAKMYGNDYVEFRDALNNWYKDHGMDLKNSMLLNELFCHILGFPYSHSLQMNNPKPKSSRCPCSKDMAKKILPFIEGEYAEAENLRRSLQMIAANKFKDSKQTFFQQESPPMMTRNKKVEEKQKCHCAIV